MELNITRKQLTNVLDNELDSLGNKIKLKASSLQNLTQHVFNVAFTGIEEKAEVAVETPVEDKKYDLLPVDFGLVANGESKPINVKGKMLEGMRKNYAKIVPFVSMVSEPVEPSFVETPDSAIDVAVKEPVNVSEPKEEPVENNNIVNFSEKDDINEMYEQVNSARDRLLGIKEQAEKAEKAANESEQKVQELGVEYNENQKQLQLAEDKRRKLKKMIMAELQNQLYTMNTQEQKFGDSIISANLRNEESQNKIVDFESRISKSKEALDRVNADIARDEEKYHTLVGMSPISMEDEQVIRKVA